eukprot:1926200-Pyramimonas_sp.AAC.1
MTQTTTPYSFRRAHKHHLAGRQRALVAHAHRPSHARLTHADYGLAPQSPKISKGSPMPGPQLRRLPRPGRRRVPAA